MTFCYLKNLGSPTKWDVEPYFVYRDNALVNLPADLSRMVLDQRYLLDAEETFWHARLLSFQFDRNDLRLTFLGQTGRLIYEFSYHSMMKALNDFSTIRSMPTLIVQELITLKNNNGYRHALSDLGGRYLVIYARRMTFAEYSRQ